MPGVIALLMPLLDERHFLVARRVCCLPSEQDLSGAARERINKPPPEHARQL